MRALSTQRAKLAEAIWKLSWEPEPLLAAMSYHRARGEDELEAAAYWGGRWYMPRVFPQRVERERSKAFGRAPEDAPDRFARWLVPWLAPRLAKPEKLKLVDIRRWLGWFEKIQSATFDDWHAVLERVQIARVHRGKPLATKQGFCPFCAAPLEVQYAGDMLVAARCTATNARMPMHAGDFLHRNMFAARPTGRAFNAFTSSTPDFYCARCGAKHRARKTSAEYTIQMQCPRCKHGYTAGLFDALWKSMCERHERT